MLYYTLDMLCILLHIVYTIYEYCILKYKYIKHTVLDTVHDILILYIVYDVLYIMYSIIYVYIWILHITLLHFYEILDIIHYILLIYYTLYTVDYMQYIYIYIHVNLQTIQYIFYTT